MKVVVIVGTKGPFPRLVAAVARWGAAHPDADIWVQHAGQALPSGLDGAAAAPHAEIMRHLEAADRVVCHAGSGTIRDALKLGHVPIVVPRLLRFGEHVNDHQLELVEALGERIVPCIEAEKPAVFEVAMARGGRGTATALPGDVLRSDLRDTLAAVRPSTRAPLVWAVMEAATRPIARWLRRD